MVASYGRLYPSEKLLQARRTHGGYVLSFGMNPTEAAVEHLRLQRELAAARKSGDSERVERARNALLQFVERRYDNSAK